MRFSNFWNLAAITAVAAVAVTNLQPRQGPWCVMFFYPSVSEACLASTV